MDQSSEIHVRRATRADTQGAWHIFQSHLNWVNVWHDTNNVVQRRQDKDFLDYLFRTYPGAVAELDGVIVGWASTENREIGVLEVMNVYVDDSLRDQGVGTAMLELIEEECHSRGIASIISFASDMYYPGKRFPTGLFQKLGYDVSRVWPATEMYFRKVPLTEEETKSYRPVRRLSYLTIDDIETEINLKPGRTLTVHLKENSTDVHS